MKAICDPTRKTDNDQRGAALITVLFISLLLLTASAAMLTALGANSRNTTDILSETKAYYAAESGLQATIHVLRNFSPAVTYSSAHADSDLSTWLPYNWPTSGTPTRVVVGQAAGTYTAAAGTAYSINVNDPDNSSGAIVYSTIGTFEQATAGIYEATRVFTLGGETLTVSYNDQSSTSASPFPITNGRPLGSFQVARSTSAPTVLPSPLRFRIDFVMSAPRPATRTMRGRIETDGAVTWTSTTYSLIGSTITLCASSTGCPAPSITLPVAAGGTVNLFGTMTQIEPYRLKVVATGYGPNGSTKKLEAIVQRNLFNDLGSSAAITMLGPNAQFTSSSTTSIQGGSVPSIVYSSTLNVNVSGSATLNPPPEVAGNDIPFWQQSPAAMDAFVRQLKQAAQNAGRYYVSGQVPSSPFGDHTAGTGITFVDGNVTLNGNGGGILVVTGNFTSSSTFSFNGLMLVLGPNGVNFSSTATITGNLVIAPYNPNNLAAGWGTPMYSASSTTNATYSNVYDSAFNGTSAITDIVAGVVEK